MANQFTVIPIPPEVIDHDHTIVDVQNMTLDLLFTEGHIINKDNDSIAPSLGA